MPHSLLSGFGAIKHDTLVININCDDNDLCPPTPLTSSAFRHLFGLHLPQEKFPPVEWREFDTLLRNYHQQIVSADDTGNQGSVFLGYTSGYFHELRHAHDLMSTVYGQEILYRSLVRDANAYALLDALAEWQSAHADQPLSIPIILNDLPALPDDVHKAISHYRRNIETILEFQKSPSVLVSGYDLTHILEASATNIQMSFLNEVLGYSGVLDVMKIIIEGGQSLQYLDLLNSMRDTFLVRGFNGEQLGSVLNYLIWCSLTSFIPRAGSLSESVSPMVILESLTDYVSRKCQTWNYEEVSKVVDAFCQTWELYNPAEALQYYNNLSSHRLERLRGKFKDSSNSFNIRKSYEELLSSFSAINEVITTDPEMFFVGGNYVWGVIVGKYPAVLVRLRYNNSVYDFKTLGVEGTLSGTWQALDFSAMMMRIFLEGFGSTGDSELETIIIRLLTEDGWHGHRFKFSDRIFAG